MPPATTSETLSKALQRLLRAWSKREFSEPPEELITLRLYWRLAAQTGETFNPSAVIRRLLDQGLTLLQGRDEAAARLLWQRYLDRNSIQEMRLELNISEAHYHRLQQRALNQLVDLLLELERQAQAEYRLAVEARLEPLNYQRLFGVEEPRRRLQAAVEQPEAPWLIALDGLGGIGKTSLADALARTLIPSARFCDIAWISAQQQAFSPVDGRYETGRPALTPETLTNLLLSQLGDGTAWSASPQQRAAALARLLKLRPYLVIIDNLETVLDYQALLPTLRQWANPTKFVLTSRHSLCAHTPVCCISLAELSRADTLALLRAEIEARRLPVLQGATEAHLDSIYQVVGGNPQALKLVVGQLCALELDQVLENLKRAQGRKISDLYIYIYWQAWRLLDPAGRKALLAMAFTAGNGGGLTQLAAASGLSLADLSQALEQLVMFSLVEMGGDLKQRRYRIHRLTETFLLTEIAQWPLDLEPQ